jgi:glycosyltransferase involved in cell wall biosynthesis
MAKRSKITELQQKASKDGNAECLVMIGVAVPRDIMDALMKVDQCPQVQTYKLSWAIIRGIESAGKIVDLISTVAISDYPRSAWLWSGYRKWDRGNGSDNRLVPFINILGLKQLSRFLGCVAMLIRWLIVHQGQNRHILLYGLISAHLYAVRCVRMLFRIKVTILITDLPSLTAGQEPWWKNLLRSIDRRIVHNAATRVDGLIVLTRQIAVDFAPNIPSMVMEGIVSVESENLAKIIVESKNGRDEDFIIMYAGGLQRIYGIPLLLEAFTSLPGKDFQLWIFGRGDMEAEILHWAADDSRIYFPGLIAPEEVFRRSQQATVLINPRPTGVSFDAYSFPSKILEYMVTGRPVITTRLSGIPAEYDPFLIWLDQETPEGLVDLLRQLHIMSRDQLDDLGQRGRDYVLKEKNAGKQGERIVEFIECVNSCA